MQTWLEPGGGHRPYPAHPDIARRLVELMHSAPVDPVSPLVGTNFGEWCDEFDIQLERLYGTPLHLRGATVVRRNVRFLTPGELAVLKPQETGGDEFTLEGWLNTAASGE
jgi:hypothetical protein